MVKERAKPEMRLRRPKILIRTLVMNLGCLPLAACSGTSEALKYLDESAQPETPEAQEKGSPRSGLQVRLVAVDDKTVCPNGGVKIAIIQSEEGAQNKETVLSEEIDCGSDAGRWLWTESSECSLFDGGLCTDEKKVSPGDSEPDVDNLSTKSLSPTKALLACAENGQQGCSTNETFVAADLSLLLPENIRSGVTVAGVTGTFSDRPSDCIENGQEGCVSTGLFKAADLSGLLPSSIRYGRSIAGVTGIYPSAMSPLEGASGSDLPSFSATVAAGQYQCFKSDGSRVAGSIADAGNLSPGTTDQNFTASLYRGFVLPGEAGLQASSILSGVSIYGVSGNVALPPKANVTEGTFFGPGGSTYEGEIEACEAPGSVGCITSNDFKPYESCTYDGQVNCAANSTFQAWAPIGAVVSTSVTNADEDGSIDFTISTTNVPDGGSLFYRLSGTGITAGDFMGGALSGFVTITDDEATVTVPLREDSSEEGTETVVLTAYRMVNSGSATINDTSRAYLPDSSLTRAWYDASSLASLTLDGPLVSEWKDLGPSGYHLTQTDPTEQPTFVSSGWNGGALPYLDWGAINNSKSLENATSGIEVREVFIVAQFEGASFTNYHGLINHTGASESGVVLLTSNGGSNIYSGGSFHSNLFLNGVFSASPVLLPTISSPFVAHTRVGTAVSMSGLVLGGDRTPFNSGRGWRGKIAEVMLYGDVLSNEMRAKTEGYLAWKWGIQGSLNASHPYKSLRP
jgi:hypothetical protein